MSLPRFSLFTKPCKTPSLFSSSFSSSSSSLRSHSRFDFNPTFQKRFPKPLPIGAMGSTFSTEASNITERTQVDYNWREEWYPLYLSDEVPHDAPLGLSVYDIKLVLFRSHGVDGGFCCFQDRCPHRLAKLSEGQLIDGRLECLYHGWQFGDDGECLEIPQLPEGGKIPNSACAKPYNIRDSQGVIWVWMSTTTTPVTEKLPYFEHYSRPDFQAISTIHELPYDHSIVLENFMDPAHVPISHDRSDFYSKREDAQPLLFQLLQRTSRGFSGTWAKSRDPTKPNFLRFEAPCTLQNNHEYLDKNGTMQYVSSLFLCRPVSQGKSSVIIRFGTTLKSPVMKILPTWFFHQNICKVLEQDMGFLSSQNEVLIKERKPVGKLYINIATCDAWVLEYRKWKDMIGHGMPYYFGNSSVKLPKEEAVVEHLPAGIEAGVSASMPAKGGVGGMHASSPVNRYFRHVVHCKECRKSVKGFWFWKNVLAGLAFLAVALAVLATRTKWKALFLVSASVFLTGWYLCSSALNLLTTNYIRNHRRY